MHLKIFNIPFQIKLSFIILLVLFSGILSNPSLDAVLICLIAILSLVTHELGHALAAKYYKANPSVELHMLGGTTQYYTYQLKQKERFLITFWGPAAQCFIWIFAKLAYSYISIKNPFFDKALFYTLVINKFWLLLNLIPILPLDGGALVESFCVHFWKEKGRIFAQRIALTSLLIAVPLLVVHGHNYFIFLLLYFVIQRYRKAVSDLFLIQGNFVKDKRKLGAIFLAVLATLSSVFYFSYPALKSRIQGARNMEIYDQITLLNSNRDKILNRVITSRSDFDEEIYQTIQIGLNPESEHIFLEDIKKRLQKIQFLRVELLELIQKYQKDQVESINRVGKSKLINLGIDPDDLLGYVMEDCSLFKEKFANELTNAYTNLLTSLQKSQTAYEKLFAANNSQTFNAEETLFWDKQNKELVQSNQKENRIIHNLFCWLEERENQHLARLGKIFNVPTEGVESSLTKKMTTKAINLEGFDVDELFTDAKKWILKFASEHQNETFYSFCIIDGRLNMNSVENWENMLQHIKEKRAEWLADPDTVESLRYDSGDWGEPYEMFADLRDSLGFDDLLFKQHRDFGFDSSLTQEQKLDKQKSSAYHIAMRNLIGRLLAEGVFDQIKRTEDFKVHIFTTD